jgi:hypothetical protein
MKQQAHRKFHYAGFLFAVFLYLGGAEAVRAVPQDFCDDPSVCGPTESCNKACYVDLFENTCGGYGGVPVDPVRGNCLGECGDGYCNDLNDEDVFNCADDCSQCGDGYCDETEDCGCSADCGSCPGGGTECNGGDPEDPFCESGDACNPSGSCCSGIHASSCSGCTHDEVCRPSVNGNVWCITKGPSCNLQ